MGRTLAADTPRERLLAGAPVTERTFEASGVATTVIEAGRGDPLVLLHGPGEHATKWVGVMARLGASHRVIAPDLPGHGSTAVIDGRPTIARVLDWLDAVVETTCASPPVLVGHVLGGAIAARYAAEHPDRVARLVLVDTLGLAPFQPTPEFGVALEEYLASPDPATFERLWRRCAYDLDGVRARMGDQWETLVGYTLERMRAPGAPESLAALIELFGFPPIPPEVLAGITVPVTLVWGRHDLATSLRVAEAASARYGWPLQVIEDSADDPATEQPEQFLEAVRRA